jgi:hypothetical protein
MILKGDKVVALQLQGRREDLMYVFHPLGVVDLVRLLQVFLDVLELGKTLLDPVLGRGVETFVDPIVV